VVREEPEEPDALPWVVADPADLPLASRYCVCVEVPPAVDRVVAVPVILPEASRITARSAPPACFWRSMVWTILPEESRTTSRQIWAGEAVARANENRTGRRIAFMWIQTVRGGDSFDSAFLKKIRKIIRLI
jgi:hypothetical protein